MVLDEGQYFGALFEHNDDGTISRIKNIVILPNFDSAQVEKRFSESVPSVSDSLDVPDNIKKLL